MFPSMCAAALEKVLMLLFTDVFMCSSSDLYAQWMFFMCLMLDGMLDAACWMWNRNQQRQANDRRRKERGEGWEIRGRGREEKQGRKGNTEDINDTEQGCDERKKGVREINEVTERLVVTKAKRKTTLQWMRNTFFNKKRWSLSVQRNKLLPENLVSISFSE